MKRPISRSANFTVFIAAIAAISASSYAQQVNVVPFAMQSHGAGSTSRNDGEWDYLFTAVDDGTGDLVATNPFSNSNGVDFTKWAAVDFNPSNLTVDGRTLAWQSGPSLLGFGDPQATYGTEFPIPASGSRDATLYFRYEFSTTQEFTNLTLGAIIDDGAVVYLDGQRISALDGSCCKNAAGTNYDPLANPTQPIPYRDRATKSNGPCGPLELVVYEEELGNVTLAPGQHVLAASVHAISNASGDMAFDLRLFQNVQNEYQGEPSANGGSFSGIWGDAGCGKQTPSWTAGTAPSGPGAVARLLSVPNRDTTIYSDAAKTLGSVIFDNTRKYAIAGQGTFNFQTSDGSAASVEVINGEHEFQTVVTLSNDLNVMAAAGSAIEFNNDLLLQGHNLTISGAGAVEINNSLFTGGGAVNAAAGAMVGTGPIHGDLLNTGGTVSPGNGIGVLQINGDYRSQSPDSVLAVEIGASRNDLLRVSGELELSGELQVALADGFVPSIGDRFSILEFGSVSGSFDRLSLPTLGNGQSWEVSGLYAAGELSVVPEPSSALMLVLAGFGLALIRRRS